MQTIAHFPFGRRVTGGFRLRRFWLILAAAAANYPASSPACSECGCSLSSDWAAQGYGSLPGAQTSIRYEYYEQSDLRSGLHQADRSALALPNDTEIQHSTLNRNFWLGLDYVFNR